MLDGGAVADLQSAEAFNFVEVDADYAVDETVEAIFVSYGALENDVWRLRVAVGKELEMLPHTRVNEGVEAL